MKQQVGVWIDHRKAYVVLLTPEGEHKALIISNVETQARRGGDAPLKGPYEARQVSPDDRLQRALTKHLNIYYDSVIAAMRDAEVFFLFGPGEAKLELKRRLAKVRLAARIAALEPADKMPDLQIVAKVRKFFGCEIPRMPMRGRKATLKSK